MGFNIITRIADALGFKIPAEELFGRAARLLRIFGYRRLSGFWISGSSRKEIYHRPAGIFSANWTTLDSASINARPYDPYVKKLERLRHAVLAGPGSLPAPVRQAISEGAKLSGALGIFVQKIADDAATLTDDDVAELHQAHYTDDQIFEAIVSAALGAGLFRLECALSALHSNRPDKPSEADQLLEEPGYHKPNLLRVTA